MRRARGTSVVAVGAVDVGGGGGTLKTTPLRALVQDDEGERVTLAHPDLLPSKSSPSP